jgi:acetyltransferase-like isoleucine patch superfamily enzyme
MPVDRNHAFAAGRVYPEPSFIGALRNRRIAAAWRSFNRNATVGVGCKLGPSAWCANDGRAEKIALGDRVVCRGIVRREPFGDGLIRIGDDVYIGDDCILSCSELVEIGEATLLGHGVQIFDNNSHPLDAEQRFADWQSVRDGGGDRHHIESAPVRIGTRCWIGFGAIILRGVTLGPGSVVGAASVVTSDVAAGAVVAGNPAREIRPS